MKIKRQIINLLDKPGFRLLLRSAFNQHLKMYNYDAEVLYDKYWMHRIGGDWLIDGERFSYFKAHIPNWPVVADRIFMEVRDLWLWKYTPAEGDVILDVGAGVGYETCVFSRAVGPNGRVIAVEAHPKTYSMLEKVIKYNAVHNVLPVHAAASDSNGTVFISDDSNYEFNIISKVGNLSHVKYAVPEVRLDDLLKKHGVQHVDFIKMNIEGAEIYALPGCTSTLEKTRAVVIATHDFAKSYNVETRQFAIDVLQSHGFNISQREDDVRDYVRDHVHGTRE